MPPSGTDRATQATAQPGIFALGTAAHGYHELDLLPGTDPVRAVRAVADLRLPLSTVGGANLVVGLRPELWRACSPGDIPQQGDGVDHPVVGPDGFTMPATQHDLWLWLAGASYDTVFDLGLGALAGLASVARPASETTGWAYRHGRDLTGFVDGSANPGLLEAPVVALVPPAHPGAGGSVLLYQLWEHDAVAWQALDVAQQELVIGRTKADSVELDPQVRGPRSHVSRTDLAVQGVERKVFRRNAPYGSVGAHGTVFVGFSAEQERHAEMLRRMAGVGDGLRDALTLYTRAVSGAYYWVPPLESLARYASPEPD